MSTSSGIEQAVERARQRPGFMDRLRASMTRNKRILDRLATDDYTAETDHLPYGASNPNLEGWWEGGRKSGWW